MIGLLLTGPNASGKTTTLRTAMHTFEGNPRVVVLYGDNDKRFVDKPERVQERLREYWQLDVPVLVLEGTDRVSRALGIVAAAHRERTLECFVTEVPPAVMKAHLQARCAKSGRTFNEPYWTTKKCEYEGSKRYRNMVRSFPSKRTRYYSMDEGYTNAVRLIEDIRLRVQEAL